MLIAKRPIGTISCLGGLLSVPEAFFWSFAQMVQFNAEYLAQPGEYVHPQRATSTDRKHARNELAATFLGEWLLMFDVDHAFEPDIALRMVSLLESRDLDVLTAVYVSKTPPHPPMMHWYDQEAQMFRIISEWSPSAVLMEITRSGAGTLLIRRRVFERIRAELNEEPFDQIDKWSEDYSFFKRLQKLAIKAHCACQVESRHLVIRPLSAGDFRPEEMESYIPSQPVPTL